MLDFGALGIALDDLASLRRTAQGARSANHSPYSKFVVLAAAWTARGMFGGTNVENVNFTLTKHAEEVAMLAALLGGGLISKFSVGALYVTGASPCGSCRQFLAEFACPDTLVLVDRIPQEVVQSGDLTALGTESIEAWSLTELLPAAFNPGELRG